MPTYEYECSTCGAVFDCLQRIADPALKNCIKCGAPTVRKRITAPAVHTHRPAPKFHDSLPGANSFNIMAGTPLGYKGPARGVRIHKLDEK